VKVDTAEYVRSAHVDADFVRDGRPEVLFAGRSNVGKSSLLNRLLGRKGLARTSSTPGRTRAVNYFLVNGRFYFVDLPGYGYAKAGREERREWGALVDRYLRRALPQSQVVLLVDGAVGATPLDSQAYGYLQGLGAEPVVVATKIDQVPRGRRARQQSAIRQVLEDADTKIIEVSARSGEGVGELWRAIELFLGRPAGRPGSNQPGARKTD
jgi:GTP-binding protein